MFFLPAELAKRQEMKFSHTELNLGTIWIMIILFYNLIGDSNKWPPNRGWPLMEIQLN